MTFFEERARATKETLDAFRGSLETHLGGDAARILGQDTCVYVVGSGGRGEMSKYSDLDLFVARVRRQPSSVDAFQVRQAIARASYDCKLPEPSQGGEFLRMHTAVSLGELMGTPADDAGNTFTARMLLLLESRALLGGGAYDALLDAVIDAYWKDAQEHGHDYQPFVLVNDTVRYWRILLLNYVAKNVEKEKELKRPELVAERRYRSYKLRFSRCITCFSVLAELLATTARGAVTKQQVLAIVKRTPVQRVQAIDGGADVTACIERLLELYEKFLITTDVPKKDLVSRFQDKDFASARTQEGREFGDAMFELLQVLGREDRAKVLFRHMVV